MILTDRVPWQVAADLSAELMRDVYSHTYAAVAGWGFVPAPEDVVFSNWVDVTAMMHHRSGQVKPRPVERYWESSRRERPVPSADSGRRRTALKERLGIM